MSGRRRRGNSLTSANPTRGVLLRMALVVAFVVQTGAGTIDLPDSIVASDAQIEVLATGRSFCEGPAVAPGGDLYYTELGTNPTAIYRVRDGGAPALFMEDGGGANGMVFVDGALIACRSGNVARIDTATGAATDLITDYNGITLGSTNDLTMGPDGAMYFTNPNWGSDEPGNDVFRLSSEGVLTRIAEGLNKPNGIEYDPDLGRLYLCVSGDNKVVVTEVGANGDPGDWRDFADIGNPDGIVLDRHGNVYAVSFTYARIEVYAPEGVSLGSIAFRSEGEQFNTTNCTFGWGEKPYLYVTASDRVFRLKMNVQAKRQYSQSQGVVPRGSSMRIRGNGERATRSAIRIRAATPGSIRPAGAGMYTPAGRVVSPVHSYCGLSSGVALIRR